MMTAAHDSLCEGAQEFESALAVIDAVRARRPVSKRQRVGTFCFADDS